jgi:hypothetical protein
LVENPADQKAGFDCSFSRKRRAASPHLLCLLTIAFSRLSGNRVGDNDSQNDPETVIDVFAKTPMIF